MTRSAEPTPHPLDPWRPALHDMAPLLRRVVGLDPRAVARIRTAPGAASVLTRLPFAVLVGRTIATPLGRTISAPDGAAVDVTVGAGALRAWLEDDGAPAPTAQDLRWRGAIPPVAGWQRVERVPDDVVRGLVRSGALTLREAAEREGVPGAQPRAEAADVLLDAVVLSAADDGGVEARVTLRHVSAAVRMGFVARGSHVALDVNGRWTRLAAEYGSVYAERAELDLR